MAKDIMKEFLVKLGWESDDEGYRKLNTRIESAEAKILKFSKVGFAAAIGFGTALVYATDKVANLAFAAQRAGTSFTNLKAGEYAFRQLGLSAESAQAASESLANNIATFDPATLLTFARLGIKPVKDQFTNIFNLMERLRKMGPEGSPGFRLASMLAGQTMGMDPTTFRMLSEHPEQLKGFFQQNLAMGKAAGVTDEAGKQAIETFQKLGETTEKVSFQEISAVDKLDKGADRLLDWGQRALDWLSGVNAKSGGFLSAAGFSAASAGVGSLFGRLFGRVLGGGGTAAAGAGAAEAEGAGLLGPLAGIGLPLALIAGGGYMSLKHPELSARQSEENQEAEAAEGTWELIKKFEKFSQKSYRDIAGNLTIGWGHLIKAGENFGSLMTLAQGDALGNADFNTARRAVRRQVKVPLNANQFAALTDFTFNLGEGALGGSTLLKKLNAGDYEGASKQFELWDKAMKNGALVPNEALRQRRLSEEGLFNKPVTLNQKTEINVTGAGDAAQTAKAISGQQTRVNGDLVRNMKATVK
jgi:lysozyme